MNILRISPTVNIAAIFWVIAATGIAFISQTPLVGQTPFLDSLEATVYRSEAVFVGSIDKVSLVTDRELGRAVLTVNPLEVFKGKIDRGSQCWVTIDDDEHVDQIKKWCKEKKEFLFALQRSGDILVVANQRNFFRGSSRVSKQNPYFYWHNYQYKQSASLTEVINDVKAFLKTEELDPAIGMGGVQRPGHTYIYFPINKKMERFAQRALRLKLSAAEIKSADGSSSGPLQMHPIQSFNPSDVGHEVEWLGTSAVENLSHFKSQENIELLKALLVKTPIEFARTDYRMEEDQVTVYRRFEIHSAIKTALAKMGETVTSVPRDEIVWTRKKDPAELSLLNGLKDPEAYFDLDPFNPPKEFARIKKLVLRSGAAKLRAPDLSGFKELEMIQFNHTDIADISELAKLKKLKYLDLAGAPITDLSPLEGLNSLEQLNLRRTKVTDLSPLENLVKLEILNITQAPVTDLSPLQELKNLKMLYAGPTKLDMDPLKELKDLKHWFGN